MDDDLVAPVVLGVVEGGVGPPDEAGEVLVGGVFRGRVVWAGSPPTATTNNNTFRHQMTAKRRTGIVFFMAHEMIGEELAD